MRQYQCMVQNIVIPLALSDNPNSDWAALALPSLATLLFLVSAVLSYVLMLINEPTFWGSFHVVKYSIRRCWIISLTALYEVFTAYPTILTRRPILTTHCSNPLSVLRRLENGRREYRPLLSIYIFLQPTAQQLLRNTFLLAVYSFCHSKWRPDVLWLLHRLTSIARVLLRTGQNGGYHSYRHLYLNRTQSQYSIFS